MTAARAKKSGACLYVRQVRSGIGFDKSQKATLKALGLGKLRRVRELPDNKEIRGMMAILEDSARLRKRYADGLAEYTYLSRDDG